MQFSRLQMIVEECTRDLGDEGAIHVVGFYHHMGGWWSTPERKVEDPSLGVELDRCLSAKGPYRATNSKHSNFALSEIGAVVRAEFERPLKKLRLDATQRIVLRSYRNASNAFSVKYNPMTGLLGKDAFHQLLEHQLGAIAKFEGRDKEFGPEGLSPPALCLLALDIDHFKQVNDSHGHAYGDLVIRAFGVRVERAVHAFCKKSAPKIQASCAHVSGEEFFCIAWGEADTTEFESLATTILEAVSGEALPSVSELELVKRNIAYQELGIPTANARNVTCSIGGVISGVPTSRESQISATQLINQADLALYKSKSQGRNRTTFFPVILQSGGRVLEYRPDVRIGVLDIGSEVGVIKGQEFLVFHPEFTGTSPFVLDDGRTRKALGKLPKVALCTVTVFDVQRNISFCRMAEERFANVTIPNGAALEAIPLGTLSVVVTPPGVPLIEDESIASVIGIAETHRRIAGEVDRKSKVSFAVIGIRNEDQFLSEHGPGAVNRVLATACRALHKIKGVTLLGQVEPTKLILQFKSFREHEGQELETALERAEKDAGGRAKLVAGVYSPGYGRGKDEEELPDISELKARADLARYAASPEGMLEGVRIHTFTYRSAAYVLSRLLQKRDLKRGLADYERFSQIGIVGPVLDNAAGHMASANRDLGLAEALYLKAAERSPASEVVYRLNGIVIQVRQGNMAAAARTADMVDSGALEKKYKNHPFGVANYALAIAERALSSEELADMSREMMWVDRALGLEIPDSFRSRLEAARLKLQFQQRPSPTTTS